MRGGLRGGFFWIIVDYFKSTFWCFCCNSLKNKGNWFLTINSLHYFVVPLGLEPRTTWLWVRCSNRLSYRTCFWRGKDKFFLAIDLRFCWYIRSKNYESLLFCHPSFLASFSPFGHCSGEPSLLCQQASHWFSWRWIYNHPCFPTVFKR